jgi:outer membrane receptor protein involved in Fe transport
MGAALVVSLAPLTAWAQEVPAQPAAADNGPDTPTRAEQDIVVTGSRLATGFQAPTPVSVIGADRLEARGSTNIGDALNEMPAFRATQTPASSGLAAAAGYVGGRILDLRGLGSVRTLTLVDGKRFVPSTTQATVDTNMIPSILLSRAEVVTGGASAVYGSDAVAGVVNLILDKKLEGMRFNAQQSVTRYGDNATTQLGFAGGFRASDSLHIVVGAEYEKGDGIGDCQQRQWCRDEWLNFGRNPGQTGIPANNILADIRPSTVAFNGVTTPPTSAYTGRATPVLRPIDGITFGADGTPRRFQYGSMVNSLYQVGGEGEGENIYFRGLYINSPTERYNAMTNLDWEAAPGLTFGLNLGYGHLSGRHRGVAYRNTAITIQSTNPFIPRSADPTLDIPTLLAAGGLTSFTLGKGFDDIGPADIRITNDVYRAVGSVAYEIGGSWKFDAYYQFGRNNFRSDTTNGTITTRLLKAVDAVRSGGQIVCRVNADAITTNDDAACVPLNPFGYANGSTFAAAKAYVTANGYQTNKTTEHVVAANIQGHLFDLPGGPVAVGFGGEFRSDQVKGDADALARANQFFTGNGSLISGKIDVTEAYAETELPILGDTPFFQELSLSGAVRRTHYKRSSDFAPTSTVDVTTWKVGGVWEPVDFLRFRVTRSRDIRAPNVSELFGPTLRTQGILTDPARGGLQAVAPITNGSNPNLRPEKANTFTAGIVLQPKGGFLGRFRASVDYFDIQIDDAISTLGQQNIVTRCYQGDALSCSLVTRDPADTDGDGNIANNPITNIVDVFQNVNKLINRGIDFEVSYRQPLGGLGDLNLRVLASYVKDLITVDAVGPTERAGQTGLRAGTPPGIPDWTLDLLATWNVNEHFSFNTHARYIDSGFYNSAFVGAEQPGYVITAPNSSNTNFVKSKTYIDLLATYKINYGEKRDFAFYVGVDNLFDTDPPLVPGANGTGNNVIFNPVGQTFKAGFRITY